MSEFNYENKLKEIENVQKELVNRLKDILYVIESLTKEQKRIDESLLILEGKKQMLKEFENK